MQREREGQNTGSNYGNYGSKLTNMTSAGLLVAFMGQSFSMMHSPCSLRAYYVEGGLYPHGC